MANPLDIELHASGEETSSGTGDAVDITTARSCCELALVVTAASGTTPSLKVSISTAPTDSGPWRAVCTFASATTAEKLERTIGKLDRYVRATWALTGTGPAFTFALTGEAHTLYCEPGDLAKTGVPQLALDGIDENTRIECCLRATADAETALNSSYEMPITSWGKDLRGHVASRAVFYAMNHRGRQPTGNTNSPDTLIDMMGGFSLFTGAKSAAQMYFEAVAKGVLKPVGIVDQTPDEYEGGGEVVSGTRRGW